MSMRKGMGLWGVSVLGMGVVLLSFAPRVWGARWYSDYTCEICLERFAGDKIHLENRKK